MGDGVHRGYRGYRGYRGWRMKRLFETTTKVWKKVNLGQINGIKDIKEVV